MLWYAENYAMYKSRINSTSGVHLLNISSQTLCYAHESRINSTNRVHLLKYCVVLNQQGGIDCLQKITLCCAVFCLHDVHPNRIYSTSRVHLFRVV
jgi:hypothetical protein